MLKFIKKQKNAIVVLHEIYGVNDHIKKVCNEYPNKGFDVYCPSLLENKAPFLYSQQDEAYRYFINHSGFNPSGVVSLLSTIRPCYRKIIVIGFSVGATIAWLSAESKLCDGVVCYYGSRIRDYADIIPPCPCLVIFAEFEQSFDPVLVQRQLSDKASVTCHILNSHHGFSDPYGENFDCRNAEIARDLVADFISRIVQ